MIIKPEKVKNGERTTDCKPKGAKYERSWIKYHTVETNRTEPYKECSITGCTNKDVVGGHVLTKTTGRTFYILPICNSCNSSQNKAWMDVKGNRQAVEVTQEVSDEFCLRQN